MSLILRRNPPRRRTVSFDGSKEDKDPCCSCKNCEEKDTCCLCLSSDSEDEHDERLDQLRKALHHFYKSDGDPEDESDNGSDDHDERLDELRTFLHQMCKSDVDEDEEPEDDDLP